MRLGSTVQMQRRKFHKRPPDVLSVFLRHMRWLMVRRKPTAMTDLGHGPSPVRRYTSPPPPHRAPGNQDGVRGGDRGSTRVGETPGKRVGARGRGRGRARGWHTRLTARHRQGGQTYRQGRQREGEWEGRQAREGAQGSGTGVAWRRAGGTRRARGSSGERGHGTKKNNSWTGGHTGRAHRGGRAREVGGTGGQQGRKGTQCLSQRSTMPMTRIEPYRPPRPTIRERMEGRPAGEADGGVPTKGCLGRPPRSA